jgi:hypothetical protein
LNFQFRLARRNLISIAGAAGISVACDSAFSQATPDKRRAGAANFVEGNVKVADALGAQVLTMGTVLREGQTIETAANSEVHVVFDDGGFLAVRPSSRVQIEKAKVSGEFDDILSLKLLSGALRSVTGWIGKFDKHNYQLSTATATVGIRGTDHELAIIPAGEEHDGEIAGIHNWVHEGGTTLRSAGGAIDIEPGHAAWAPHTGEAPRAHLLIPRFLQLRRTLHEEKIEAHARRISEIIEMRMKKRGMLKEGERLGDAQRRHHALRESGTSEAEPVRRLRPESDLPLHRRKKWIE